MQAHSPAPPISPHPANPYTRFSANQPLTAGAVADVAPPPPPIAQLSSPPPQHPGYNLSSPPPQHPGYNLQSPPPASFVSHSPHAPTPLSNQGGGRRPLSIGIPPNSVSPHYPPAPVTGAFVSRKRLIVACDGTWQDADAALVKNQKVSPPSNVTRISRAIKSQSSDHIAQVVYYHAGVGTEGGKLSRALSGATGEGLSQNVREGYSFLANNYHPGDEIFLIGFSRGAFTVRTIGGLIGAVGLLTKAGLDHLSVVFDDWEHRYDKDYDSKHPDSPYHNKPGATDPAYARGLQDIGLTRLGVKIKAIAVWDTVGSLGIPRVPILEKLHFQKRKVPEYAFYDTTLDPCIENAFQALALDEQRGAFSPALWEKPKKGETILRQVWFPGVHSNVGGGYPDQEIANITLAWMMAQLEQFIDFHPNYIQEQHHLNSTYYRELDEPTRPWSFGEIYNSITFPFSLAGKIVRTPGAYTRVDPETGKPTRKPLRDTNEYIHPSVRTRSFMDDAPGIEDKGLYDSRAMDGYKLKMTGNRPEDNQPLAVWESRARRKGVPRKILRESPLWDTERKLLAFSKNAEEHVFKQPARAKKQQRAPSTIQEEDEEERIATPPPPLQPPPMDQDNTPPRRRHRREGR